jgi:hypothetical protein
MKMTGHRVTLFLNVAVIVGILTVGSSLFGQAPKGKYDGSYQGMYSGSFAGQPVMGSVAFSVANGAMTVTDPGMGTGTVSSTGAATFSGSLGVANIACKFVGTFQSATRRQKGASASGSWSCSGAGRTGKGTWSANQQ